MKDRRRLSLLIGAAALALTAPALTAVTLPAAQAAGQAEQRADVVVRVKDLPRRHRALDIAWLSGRVAHQPGGGTLALPWSARAVQDRPLSLIGKTAKGWLVADADRAAPGWRVWLVRRGERTLISRHGITEGEGVSFRLSRDLRRYAVTYFDGDSSSTFTVLDLNGDRIAGRGFSDDATLLDFSGPEAVIASETTSVRWDIDTDTTVEVGADLGAADLAHDLAFVPGDEGVGPTSLSDPGSPVWSAPLAQIAVSPRGDLVLSRDPTSSRRVTVRDLATGDVESSYRIDYLSRHRIAWEGDRSFVLLGSPGSLGDREVLVRCTVGGTCAAQSPRTARRTISYAP